MFLNILDDDKTKVISVQKQINDLINFVTDSYITKEIQTERKIEYYKKKDEVKKLITFIKKPLISHVCKMVEINCQDKYEKCRSTQINARNLCIELISK